MTNSLQKHKKFDPAILSCGGYIKNMFRAKVMFELDEDFTIASQSLPSYLAAKIKVSREVHGHKYMTCQMILTQEMTREDLIELVTKVRRWMDGEPPVETVQPERTQICQK